MSDAPDVTNHYHTVKVLCVWIVQEHAADVVDNNVQ